MFSNPFESYESDDDAWDWKLIMLVTGAMRAVSWEVLLTVGLLFIAGVIALFVLSTIAWFIQHIGTFLGSVYASRAQAGPQLATIIPLMFAGIALTWLFSFLFYDRGHIAWGIHINILAFSWMLFAFAMVWMHGREQQGAQQAVGIPIATRSKKQLPNKP